MAACQTKPGMIRLGLNLTRSKSDFLFQLFFLKCIYPINAMFLMILIYCKHRVVTVTFIIQH